MADCVGRRSEDMKAADAAAWLTKLQRLGAKAQ